MLAHPSYPTSFLPFSPTSSLPFRPSPSLYSEILYAPAFPPLLHTLGILRPPSYLLIPPPPDALSSAQSAVISYCFLSLQIPPLALLCPLPNAPPPRHPFFLVIQGHAEPDLRTII